jgi:hypothetical protein
MCVQIVGGVTERGAWAESEHDFGALFCNQQVYAGGAVGCIMRGPLSMQQVRCRRVAADCYKQLATAAISAMLQSAALAAASKLCLHEPMMF